MFSFALVYTCLVITTLICCAVVFGLALNSASNELVAGKIGQNNQPSVSNLVSVAAITQALWLCIPILVIYLIAVGLISVSDGLARTIFKVIAALILVPLNVWLLADAAIAFSNVQKGDNLLMNNTIYGMTIMAGILCLATSIMFIGGLVYGIVSGGSSKKSAL